MGSREQTILCSGAAGGRQALPMGATVQLITIPGTDDRFDGEPGVWAVAIGYDTADNLAGALGAELDISAEIIWGSGRGRNVAEVDVPVRGTQFTVSGAEGLTVRVTRAGLVNDATVFVSATASLARGSASIPAQRTHGPFDLSGAMALQRIPRFSRECRVVALDPTTMVGATLRYAGENAVGAFLAAVPVPNPTPMPIPLGMEFYDVVPAGQNTPIVRVIWELRL